MGIGTKRRGCKHNIVNYDYVVCPYCQDRFQMIHWQHLKVYHPSKTLDILLLEFPDYPTMTKREADRRKEARIKCNDKVIKTNNERYNGIGFSSMNLKNKTVNTIKRRYGVDNAMKVDEIKKLFTGEDGLMSKKNNPKRGDNISKALKGRPSKLKGRTYEEILGEERASTRKEEQRYFGAIGQSLTPKISEPQRIMYELIKSIEPEAILEYPTFGYCIDVAIPSKKIAIEYDCWYWHQDEERDKTRDEILSSFGWIIFRFKDRLPTKKEIKKILK